MSAADDARWVSLWLQLELDGLGVDEDGIAALDRIYWYGAAAVADGGHAQLAAAVVEYRGILLDRTIDGGFGRIISEAARLTLEEVGT